MSTENIKEVVKEKYGQAAQRVSGWLFLLRSFGTLGWMLRPDHQQPLRQQSNQPDTGRSSARFSGLWQSHHAGPA